MFEPSTMLWLVPSLPLAAAILTAFLGPTLLKRFSHLPTILATAASCAVAVLLLAGMVGSSGPLAAKGYTWFQAGQFAVTMSLQADTLTLVMLVTVTFVGTFIAIFSAGYMHDDPGYPRYFAVMSLFLFSMTGLVLADNFLTLYAFWEGVGLCSYLLIGFWFQKPSAAAAARKGFLVTRLGDAGMILGIMLLWSQFGHRTDFVSIFHEARSRGDVEYLLTPACLLLFCGAVGKSAQFPLHVWLPDAMEGPTPASALIHAATMVTAGVYLVARCTPLFVLAPAAQLVVGCIGGFTALLAALIALTQNDLKRVLAYSTISQLGYMFLALGAGVRHEGLAIFAATAAIFHLFTHAFFKALLFLAAGSVMHAMGGVIDVRKIGGLRKILPITHWTFLCGALALAGLIPFAGFWSKDEVLESVLQAGEHADANRAVYFLLFAVGILTAALTAFYTFRVYFRTFWGAEKVPHEAHHPHESPNVMAIPLIVLAVGAALVGVVFEGATHWFSHFLSGATSFTMLNAPEPEHHTNWLLILGSTVAAAGGIGLAAYFYYLRPLLPILLAHTIRPAYELSRNKFHIDEIYILAVVHPLTIFAAMCRLFDGIVDGVVDLVGALPRIVAKALQPIQNGLVQFYALVMMVFLTAFLTIFILWFRQ
ncbi:MAG: NADH-quinone oxidoreductase subunit L [Gemmataceae bacterium]